MTDPTTFPDASMRATAPDPPLPPPPPPLPKNIQTSVPRALPQSSTDGLASIASGRARAHSQHNLVVRRSGLQEDESTRRVRVVCISDTHEKHRQYDIPDGDVLVHTGDFFSHLKPKGREHFVRAVTELNDFFASLPHRHKIFVAGNHEMAFDHAGARQVRSLLTNAHYLLDSGCVLEGIKFYGSPWTTTWTMAFPGRFPWKLADRWNAIPDDTDVLLTHNPPLGILDLAWVKGTNSRECTVCGASRHFNKTHWGCKYLRDTVLKRVRPLVHAFGHVHDAHGVEWHDGVLFVNSALELSPHPVVFDVCVSRTSSDSSNPSAPSQQKVERKSCLIS